MFHYFYNGHVRRLISAFGTIFNNILIVRTNSAGQIASVIHVPLSYGPIDKILSGRQNENKQAEELEEKNPGLITLPRISYEMSNMTYDSSRKRATLSPMTEHKSGNHRTQVIYPPSPYNFEFSLYVAGRNHSDCLQIVEQILPYFQPDFTISLKSYPLEDRIIDVPIILGGVSYDDNYESGDSTRLVVYTLNFTAKYELYGPGLTDNQTALQDYLEKNGDPRDLDPVSKAFRSSAPDLKPHIRKMFVDIYVDFDT